MHGCLVIVSVCIIAWMVIGGCISGVIFMDHSIRSLFQTRVGGCRVALANATHEAVGDGVGGSHAVGRLEAAWFVGDHGDGVLFGDLAEDFVLVAATEQMVGVRCIGGRVESVSGRAVLEHGHGGKLWVDQVTTVGWLIRWLHLLLSS